MNYPPILLDVNTHGVVIERELANRLSSRTGNVLGPVLLLVLHVGVTAALPAEEIDATAVAEKVRAPRLLDEAADSGQWSTVTVLIERRRA